MKCSIIKVLSMWFITFLTIQDKIFGQSTLTFDIIGGLMMPLCSYNNTSERFSGFNINHYDELFEDGFIVTYNFNNKHFISSGVYFTPIGYSYKISVPKYMRHGYGDNEGSSTALGIYRFPVTYGRKIFEKTLFHKKRLNDPDFITFRTYIKVGACLDYLPDIWDISDLGLGPHYSLDTILIIRDTSTVINRFSPSLYFGLGFSLHNNYRNRDIAVITIYYCKGFVNMMDIDILYQVNNYNGHAKLYSKGTDFGINITFPIKLYTFKGKNGKKD